MRRMGSTARMDDLEGLDVREGLAELCGGRGRNELHGLDGFLSTLIRFNFREMHTRPAGPSGLLCAGLLCTLLVENMRFSFTHCPPLL